MNKDFLNELNKTGTKLKTYKIVEEEDGVFKTLFHGVNKSRILSVKERLKADIKTVRDGSGNRWYKSGWHTIPSYDDAVSYLKNFKNRTEKLKIVLCEIENYWPKEHSKSNILLSEYLTIMGKYYL